MKDTEIVSIYKEEKREGVTANKEQQNNQNEETSETKWQNIKRW